MNGIGGDYANATIAEAAALGDAMHVGEDRPSGCDCWLVPAPNRHGESLWLVKRRGSTCRHTDHLRGAVV